MPLKLEDQSVMILAILTQLTRLIITNVRMVVKDQQRPIAPWGLIAPIVAINSGMELVAQKVPSILWYLQSQGH